MIPVAGEGTRIAPLPFSKELYPIGFSHSRRQQCVRPKVVCHYLLEKMRLAGITKVYFILREGKWDIPTYFRDGIMLDMQLAYLMMRLPFGAPYTIDQAYPFVKDSLVAVGFPDIVFSPDDAFLQLRDRQQAIQADVVLGLFPADRPDKVDMVDVDDDGWIRRIVIKPRQTDLRYTWGIAVWTPTFTQFLHEFLRKTVESAASQPELFVGDIVQKALENGLKVIGVHVSDEPYLDIGTPEDLVKAAKRFVNRPA